MKLLYLKGIILAILSIICITASAYNCEVDGIYYNLNTKAKTASVTYQFYSSSSNRNRNAYRGSVNIPPTVTYNGTIYSVTSIDWGAFMWCTELTSIVIPSSVTSIGATFDYCNNLETIVVASGNTVYDSRNQCNAIIETASNTLIRGCKNTIIPNSVTSIGQGAFENMGRLATVIIPKSVTSIGNFAFYGCIGLTKVTIPNSVTTIGNDAFSGCEGLTSVTIGNNVTTIGEYAFSWCSDLNSITIPNSVTSIGSDAFSGTAWYDNQPDGLVYAGKVAYKYKGAMPANTEIRLIEDTNGIAGCAFNGCEGLTKVTIPNSVTTIGNDAFSGCI